MPLSELASALVRRDVVTPAAAREAEQRRKLYGGSLDTALLELGASDEATLLRHLAEILGIPLAPAHVLNAASDRAARAWMDRATAQHVGAAPQSKVRDALFVLLRPEHDHDALVAWAAEHALLVEPALVCEARFRAYLAALYDVPLSPRYLALLAKLVGSAGVRRIVGTGPGERGRQQRGTPTPEATGVDAVEILLAAARFGEPAERLAALQRLSSCLHDSRVIGFRQALLAKAAASDITAAQGALGALAELKDKNAVPAIAELLDKASAEVARAAHAVLVQLTCEDVGTKTKRWLDFWNRMGRLSRVEWLLEALAHRSPELRLQACAELHERTGEYFGYHYDLPERDREEARQRWIAWWRAQRKDE
jgi:hypothetical protein